MSYTTRTIQARGIWQGEDVTWTFVTDDNLSDGVVDWKLTTAEGGGVDKLTKTGTILGAGFSVTLTDVETAALDPGHYWHEAKFTSAGGLVSQIIAPSTVVIYQSAI
jgi:hypothetical protein